jgi:hypothetical protein
MAVPATTDSWQPDLVHRSPAAFLWFSRLPLLGLFVGGRLKQVTTKAAVVQRPLLPKFASDPSVLCHTVRYLRHSVAALEATIGPQAKNLMKTLREVLRHSGWHLVIFKDGGRQSS